MNDNICGMFSGLICFLTLAGFAFGLAILFGEMTRKRNTVPEPTGPSPKEIADTKEAQRRREEARVAPENLFLEHALEIAERFTRNDFDSYVRNYLGDNRSADYVERRAQDLMVLIREHLRKATPDPSEGDAKAIAAARRSVERCHQQNQSIIEDEFSAVRLTAELKSQIPDDASTTQAWSAAVSLINTMEEIVKRKREKQSKEKAEADKKSRELAEVDRKIAEKRAEIVRVRRNDAKADPDAVDDIVEGLEEQIRNLEQTRQRLQ